MRVPIVVMVVLFVATLFVEPVTDRAKGEPLSLACVGLIVAAGALRRRASE